MAATFASIPPKWAHTEDPIWVRVETDNLDTSPVNAQFILAFGDDLTAGQTLTIAWADESVVLSVAASPSGNLEIPATTSSEASVRNLIDYLYRQPAIARDWSIQYQPIGDHRLVATYRTVDELDVSVTLVGGVSGPDITVTDKADPYLEENLTAYLQVLAQDTQESSAWLREYVGAFDPETAVAEFDIRAAFNLKPHVPDYATGAFGYDTATNCFEKYRVQCADRFGATPAPQRMDPVSNRLAIFGGVPLDSTFALNDGVDTVQVLHHYKRHDNGATFPKPIAFDGVDYIYFVVPDDVQLSFKVKSYYFDGSTATDALHVSPIEFYADEVSWIHAGPIQLDLANVVTDWAEVMKYDIQIYLEEGDVSTLKASVSYEVDWKNRPWNIDLLYANGCGGMEVLRAIGKATFETGVSSETAEAQATYGDDPTTGRLINFAREGRDRILVEVGWQQQWVLHHIAQVLYSDVWALEEGEWIRYRVATDSLQIRKDDAIIGSFKFTIEKAFNQSNRVR